MGCNEPSIKHISLSFDKSPRTDKHGELMKILRKFLMKAATRGAITNPSNYIMKAFNAINWAAEDAGADGWGKGGKW